MLELASHGGRVPDQLKIRGNERTAGAYPNEMILVYAVVDSSVPACSPSDLAGTPISLDDQQVPHFKLVPGKFAVE